MYSPTTESAVGKSLPAMCSFYRVFDLLDMTVVPIPAYAIPDLTKRKLVVPNAKRHDSSPTALNRGVTLNTSLSSLGSEHWQLIRNWRRRCVIEVNLRGPVIKAKCRTYLTASCIGLSTDGVAIFKKRSKTAWPIVLFNYNLPPDIRFHKKNLIPVGVIPGPKKPTDMDSFLYPLVQELLQFEIGVKAFDTLTKTLFILHAYLIVVIGDIPAVALLMRMKGHNAFSPCRMCEITGVREPPSTTHYVPLYRQSSASYNPSNLPMRTREGFMNEAEEVQFAINKTIAEHLAKEFGINGIPLLSSLSSLSFPASFPYDFMHLIWENLIPHLISFWTGEFKDIPHSGKGYVLETSVWKEICSISAMAGNTILAAFGCRVPDMSTQRWQLTSESRAMWTLFIAPVVLRGQFIEEKYYQHFLDLVRLLNMCLEYELAMEQVAEIKQGFIKWVKDYER